MSSVENTKNVENTEEKEKDKQEILAVICNDLRHVTKEINKNLLVSYYHSHNLLTSCEVSDILILRKQERFLNLLRKFYS